MSRPGLCGVCARCAVFQRFDEGRLAQKIMLAAWAHGVGSCIASIYPDNNKARARTLRVQDLLNSERL